MLCSATDAEQWCWAALLILMRINRGVWKKTSARCLLKKLVGALEFHRKSTFTSLLNSVLISARGLGMCFLRLPKSLQHVTHQYAWKGSTSMTVAERSSGVIGAQSIQFYLFYNNTFCLLKVFWSLGARARTTEQLISCSSPRVHPLIRSQIQHICHLCPNSQDLLSE